MSQCLFTIDNDDRHNRHGDDSRPTLTGSIGERPVSHPCIVRFQYRDDKACDLWGELVGETEKFWKYRSYCTGKVERTAKTILANIDQGLGRTDWGRFRGNVLRMPSKVHFEPCPYCPDWGQAAR